jgi:hypothetical protein
MKTGLFFTTIVLFSVFATAQSPQSCDSVIKKIAFENTSGLSKGQQAELSKLLMGRCFQREHPGVLSEAIYEQLRKWGYKRPTVYDPDKGADIRVLDSNVHPSPVAVTIDFRLTGLDKSQK